MAPDLLPHVVRGSLSVRARGRLAATGHHALARAVVFVREELSHRVAASPRPVELPRSARVSPGWIATAGYRVHGACQAHVHVAGPAESAEGRRPHVAVCGFTQFMCGPAPKCLPPGLSDWCDPCLVQGSRAPTVGVICGAWRPDIMRPPAIGRVGCRGGTGADRGGPMSQTDVERTLGRVLTHAAFRQGFFQDPARACLLLGVQWAPHEL